jgi:hypothetical protein
MGSGMRVRRVADGMLENGCISAVRAFVQGRHDLPVQHCTDDEASCSSPKSNGQLMQLALV